VNPPNPFHPRSIRLEITADGSHTLFLPEMDEHYHSIHGATQESHHVYIESGLNQCLKPYIHVLEMGFGTGLNALLTALEAEKRNIQVIYTALEKYPVPLDIAGQLNYSDIHPTLFSQIHTAEWESLVSITPSFRLQKIQTDFNTYTYPDPYDVVYYDAFAPDKQSEVWLQPLADAIFKAMNPQGILTTYCAKGAIRRMMQQAGFVTERIPGPPGKREMLRARREK
jgi:tRNA U34 5-methylaminomethyl-2-thiouridine-forming methyltransferase MnmC